LLHSSSVLVALVLAAILLVIAMILATIFLLVPMVLATILHNVLSWGSHVLGLLVLLNLPCWEMDDDAKCQRRISGASPRMTIGSSWPKSK